MREAQEALSADLVGLKNDLPNLIKDHSKAAVKEVLSECLFDLLKPQFAEITTTLVNQIDSKSKELSDR